ncbi:MAG TPA: LacI family DNA-binding transcriptional regulator [Acidobacteriaceae bacterium]|jgi:LacI family transcriptional regulator
MAGSRRKSSNAMPTLVHVARLAGVGLGTASRALSGDGYVSEETSARIHTAALQLRYQRNELARSLKTNRSGAIGLIIPDIGGPFMASCVRAIQKVTRQAGYMLIIAFTNGNEKVEAEEVDYMIRHQIDGIMIVPAAGSAAPFSSLQMKNIPLIAFDQPIGGDEYDAVVVKNRQGARAAVEHLIWHGHKRIACLGVFRQLYSIQQRIEGYRAAMKDAKLPMMLEIINPDDDGVGKQIDKWLAAKNPPTAIFSLNELTSLETVEALAIRGLRMPTDIAFVGFDDIQLGPYLDPPLTAVLQPAASIGEHTATRMLERIKSTETLQPKRVLLDVDLIIRGSCGCPAVKAARRTESSS